MNCACMSVGKPGCGAVEMSTALGSALPRTRMLAFCRPDLDAGRAQLRDHRLQVLGRRASSQHVAAGDRRRHHERAGLDAVGDDGVIDRVQLARRLRCMITRCPAPSMRAPILFRRGQLLDLGLARGVLERGAALGQRRGHHQVLGAGDGRACRTRFGALQPLRARRST